MVRLWGAWVRNRKKVLLKNDGESRMLNKLRGLDKDVTDTVDVTDWRAVCAAIVEIFEKRYPGEDVGVIPTLVEDFHRLYSGEYPGFHACDIGYHNIQHVLDVSLAMARLIDGFEKCHRSEEQLGLPLALAGLASALFHDAGYIRHRNDTKHKNGAEYTRVHVSRSARFLTKYLPTVGLDYAVPICKKMVHFTGYEVNPNDISVPTEAEKQIGWLLGTADLIAQMADVAYLEKCRDKLYPEFEEGGTAGTGGIFSAAGVIYKTPQQLMESTPNFIRTAVQVRLDGYFHQSYRYAAEHFGGDNLYMDAIYENCSLLEAVLAKNNSKLLMKSDFRTQ